MPHPLTEKLSVLSEKDLGDKIIELHKKLAISYRLGNYSMSMQIQNILFDYMEEQRTRSQKQLEELLKANNKKFGDVIDIK